MSKQDEFETRAREVLEESATKLDGRTLSRLTQARHAALGQLAKPRRHWMRRWMPAGAAAAAAVLAVMIWTGPVNDPAATLGVSANGGSAFEDLDLLADAPEFVGEADDVEFYEWAADELES